MQARRRDKGPGGAFLLVVGVAVLLLLSFFVNIYLFLSNHASELAFEASLRSLQAKERDSSLALEERVAQLDAAMKSKHAASSKFKVLAEDCGVVSTWFQQLWDALANLLDLPEGDNEQDLRDLLSRLREEGNRPQEASSFLVKIAREQELTRSVATRDRMLQSFREYLHTNAPRTMKVYWATECGCTGIQVEALNLVFPLWQKGMNIRLSPCDIPCDFGLAPDLQQMVNSMASMKWGLREADVVVIHYSYNGICPIEKLSGSQYNVMRTMFETDGLEPSAVQRCNSELINEIWVPTNFNVQSMKKAGVAKPLLAMPESLDVSEFNPAALSLLTPPPVIQRLQAKRKGFNFLSNFKFESRKNWKGLVRAFVEEFAPEEDVALFIFTHKVWEGEPVPSIQTFLRLELNRTRVPAIHVIEDRLTSHELPFLYSSMDAFVLPTHGEGWGLPILEAMLMELPVIVTDWGGSTEFAGGPGFHGYPLRVQKLEFAWDRIDLGQWAVPSPEDLRARMREAFSEPTRAKQLGRLAREDVVWKYSQEAVAVKYLQRLNIIEKSLGT